MSKGGGETTSKVELPPELTAEAIRNIGLTDFAADIGYNPFKGGTVAGFSPQQLAAMQGTDQAASAFGMPSAVNWQAKPNNGGFTTPPAMGKDMLMKALTGMSAPDTATGMGFGAYSPAAMYAHEKSKLPQETQRRINNFGKSQERTSAPQRVSLKDRIAAMQANR